VVVVVVVVVVVMVMILIWQVLSCSMKYQHKNGTSQLTDPQHQRITVSKIAEWQLGDTNCPLGFRTVET